MQNSESGIPVLTEVLQTPVYGVDLPERRGVPHPAVVPAGIEVAEASYAHAAIHAVPGPLGAPDAATLARIKQDVTEAVLQKLLGQLDLVLESRIRDELADVLQSAVDNLACQLRAGLKQALDESVSMAVAAELSAVRNLKIENIE